MKRMLFMIVSLALVVGLMPVAFVGAENGNGNGGGVIVYGIFSRSTAGNLAGSLYEIDVENQTQTLLYQDTNWYPHPYGNALAFDQENERLYFTLSDSGSVAKELWFYDFTAESTFNANAPGDFALGKNVCGAAFGDGYYWYIPDGTTSLRRMSFNPDGTVDVVETFATLSPAPGGFGDIVYRDGIIYGSTQTRYFTYDTNTNAYSILYTHGSSTNLHNHLGVNLQLAWGSDGTLYGHSYLNRTWWDVDPETGIAVQIPFVSQSYGDLASGPIATVQELSDICGYKHADWQDDLIPLPLWEIILDKYDETEGWGEMERTTTDADGHYCFLELEPGTYRVSETLKPGWEQVSPASNQHIVTLPLGDDDPEKYNFVNTPALVCGRDTAWARGNDPTANNSVAGNPSNAWGWTNYFDGEAEFPFVMDLYAGAGRNDITKGRLVGTVTVDYYGGCVTVTYEVNDLSSLAEVHVWVGSTPLPTQTVTRGKRTVTTVTAAPGQFDKHVKYDHFELQDTKAMFKVCDVNDSFWVAAHAVVEWCKPDPRAWDELEGLLSM